VQILVVRFARCILFEAQRTDGTVNASALTPLVDTEITCEDTVIKANHPAGIRPVPQRVPPAQRARPAVLLLSFWKDAELPTMRLQCRCGFLPRRSDWVPRLLGFPSRVNNAITGLSGGCHSLPCCPQGP